MPLEFLSRVIMNWWVDFAYVLAQRILGGSQRWSFCSFLRSPVGCLLQFDFCWCMSLQVCCSGHGKNGALCVLQRSIRPEMITEVCSKRLMACMYLLAFLFGITLAFCSLIPFCFFWGMILQVACVGLHIVKWSSSMFLHNLPLCLRWVKWDLSVLIS